MNVLIMAKYTLSRKQLKEHINSVVSEAIDDYINGDADSEMYSDNKRDEMDADWRDIDDQAKDTQARYGYNAQELDNLNAYTDTVDQYLDDLDSNKYDNGNGLAAMNDYDRAEAERGYPVESIVRKAVREAISEMGNPYLHPENSNGNQFASNHSIDANKFAHNGADAYDARKDQDKMHKREKNKMRRADKRAMNAADKRPLHRKGSLNRAFDEAKSRMNESLDGYMFSCYRKGIGNDSMIVDDLNDIKPYIKDATYWDITKGANASEPENLIAWGGQGGYWANMLEDPNLRERDRELILRKKKEIGGNVMSTEESKLRRSVREALIDASKGLNKKGRKINEEWYPDDDEDISDYSYGAIMTLDVNGVFDDITPEKAQEVSAIHDEYIENGYKYTSVMVRKVNIIPDGYEGYDVSLEVAVSAPDMPIHEIENEVQELAWYWVEEKLGVRSPNIEITDERVVFDNRVKNA